MLSDKGKDSSIKFWELEKRINKDKYNPGIMVRMSRSNTYLNMASLINLKVIDFNDLADFSDELKEDVRYILDNEVWDAYYFILEKMRG